MQDFFFCQIEHAPNVPVVPSSILGMNAFIPPGPVAALHPYLMNPLGVPQAVASSNSPIPQSHIDHFQSVPVVLTQQHLQNQQVWAPEYFKGFFWLIV